MFFHPFNKWAITWNNIKQEFEKTPILYSQFLKRKQTEVLFSFTNTFAFLIKHSIFLQKNRVVLLMFGRNYGMVVDLKESKTMESTKSFSVQAEWQLGSYCRLQTAKNSSQEGGMLPNTKLGKAPLLAKPLCLGLILGCMWSTNHQEPACKILWQRLFSFSPWWPFCVVKKGIT